MRILSPRHVQGFTLIEILAVIAITAILGYLGMGSLNRGV
jgi:prepilin-type N-terminal cleavage/methylation domain-containing protein